MIKLTLKKTASRCLLARHHRRLTPWVDHNPQRSDRTCLDCGMIACVNTHPLPNSTHIGGNAVALDCPLVWIHEHEEIRQVRFVVARCVFTLSLYDLNKTDQMGKAVLGYTLRQGNKVLFWGEDFHCSPLHAIDSDATVKSLMAFLTLKPGDTDREYFDNYTPSQRLFCEQFADELQLEVQSRFGHK